MPRAAKPAKRVSFGSVTYLSASPIEDSEGIDLRESSRLLDAPAPHPWMRWSAKFEIVAAVAAPFVHNKAGGLLGIEKSKKYAVQPEQLDSSSVDKPYAPLSSARPAANVGMVDNRREGDTEDLRAESPQRGNLASSPVSSLGSSDDDTYDTPLERRLTWRHLEGATQCDGVRKCDPPSFISETLPTMSQLVSAVDDVLGGTQHTQRIPLAASSFAVAPQCSLFFTEGAADRSYATNPSSPTPTSATKVQMADLSCTREVGGAADSPLKARHMPQQREEESITTSETPCRASELPLVSTERLPASNTASWSAHTTFCAFCGIDAPFGNACETPPLCFSDGIAYHTACALWCPDVFYDTEFGGLRGIAEASHRSRLIKCAWCRQPGAAVGCACPACQLSFHVPCAVRARASMNMQTFVLYCPAHRSVTDDLVSTDLLDPKSGEATLKRKKRE